MSKVKLREPVTTLLGRIKDLAKSGRLDNYMSKNNNDDHIVISGKSSTEVKAALRAEFDKRIAAQEAFKAKLALSIDMGKDLKTKEAKAVQEINVIKQPHVLKAHEIQKDIDRLERQRDKELEGVKKYDMAIEEIYRIGKDAFKAYEQAQTAIKKCDEEIAYLKQECERAVNGIQQQLFNEMNNFCIKDWGKAMAGEPPRCQYQFDEGMKKMVLFFPFGVDVWTEFRRGLDTKAAKLAGKWVWNIIKFFDLSFEEIGIVGTPSYTICTVISTPDRAERFDQLNKNDSFTLSGLGGLDDDPWKFFKIPSTFWEEMRDAFI